MKRVINGVLLVLSVAAAVMPAFSIGGTQFGIIDLTEGVETYMLMCIDAMPVVLVILIPPVLAFIINLIRPIPARISAVVTSVLALAEAAMWIILEQYLSRLCKDYFSEYVDALNLTIFFFAIMIALAAVIMTSVLIMFTGDSKLRSDSAPAEELNTKKEQEICKDRTLPAKKPFRVRKIQKTVKISDGEDRIITPGRKTCREALLMALFGIAGVIIGAIIVLITVNSCVINRPYTSFQEYDQAIVDTGDAIPDEVVEVEPAKPAGTAEIEPAKTIEVDKADPAQTDVVDKAEVAQNEPAKVCEVTQTESTEDFEDYEAVEIEPATIATEEYDTEEYDHEYDNGCGYGYDNSYNDDSINIESRVQCEQGSVK